MAGTGIDGLWRARPRSEGFPHNPPRFDVGYFPVLKADTLTLQKYFSIALLALTRHWSARETTATHTEGNPTHRQHRRERTGLYCMLNETTSGTEESKALSCGTRPGQEISGGRDEVWS